MLLFQDPTPNAAWLYDPRFWLLAGGAAVALIMWFARLEFKTNANEKRQVEHEAAMAEELHEAKEERKDIKTAFYKHAGDTSIHHNADMFDEFKKGLDLRFNSLQDSVKDMKATQQQALGEINRKLDHLADRE